MEMNFCRRCGAATEPIEPPVFYKCKNGHDLFASPSPTAGVFLLSDNLDVTVAVRGREPGKGMLDTPGGFIDLNENAVEALQRELREELNLEPSDYSTPEYLCSAAGDYPYQGEDRAVVSMIYVAKLKPGAHPVAQDDVAAISTRPLTALNPNEFSGDDIKQALILLKSKLL